MVNNEKTRTTKQWQQCSNNRSHSNSNAPLFFLFFCSSKKKRRSRVFLYSSIFDADLIRYTTNNNTQRIRRNRNNSTRWYNITMRIHAPPPVGFFILINRLQSWNLPKEPPYAFGPLRSWKASHKSIPSRPRACFFAQKSMTSAHHHKPARKRTTVDSHYRTHWPDTVLSVLSVHFPSWFIERHTRTHNPVNAYLTTRQQRTKKRCHSQLQWRGSVFWLGRLSLTPLTLW